MQVLKIDTFAKNKTLLHLKGTKKKALSEDRAFSL